MSALSDATAIATTLGALEAAVYAATPDIDLIKGRLAKHHAKLDLGFANHSATLGLSPAEAQAVKYAVIQGGGTPKTPA